MWTTTLMRSNEWKNRTCDTYRKTNSLGRGLRPSWRGGGYDEEQLPRPLPLPPRGLAAGRCSSGPAATRVNALNRHRKWHRGLDGGGRRHRGLGNVTRVAFNVEQILVERNLKAYLTVADAKR